MALREKRLMQIRQALRGRRVAWFATRGIDVYMLGKYGLLDVVVSQLAPLRNVTHEHIVEDCLEQRLKIREDINRYDIDTDTRLEATSLRDNLLRRASSKGDGKAWILGAYRPANFLAAAHFTRSDVTPCYMFAPCQRVFEHKPWVESQLENLGLKTLGWQYVRDSEEDRVSAALQEFERVVVRSNHSDGGLGLRRITSIAELRERMPQHDDGFVGFCPYLRDAVPLNINACVYGNGEVRSFQISLQLIGIEGCTDLVFGFCGNDFCTAADIEQGILREAESIAGRVGQWAAGLGYRGQFGLDFLLYRGELLITEMNPRFQASTTIAEVIAEQQELPGPYIEHLAAFLGLPPPGRSMFPTVKTQTAGCFELKGCCALAQIICYNDRGTSVQVIDTEEDRVPSGAYVVGVPADGIIVRPGAMLGKVITEGGVSSDGLKLHDGFADVRGVFRTSPLV